MPAPFPPPKQGDLVENHPAGFPVYFKKRQPRVVTADVWAFYRLLVVEELGHGPAAQRAFAYIDQAFEFYEAASNPGLSSKPLLYFYSFLNLAKTAILLHCVKLQPAPRHGIIDPRVNARVSLRLEGQTVRIEKIARDHSQLFPEFVEILGGKTDEVRQLRIVDILAQIPSVHRTFCRIHHCSPCLLPISKIEVLKGGRVVWARVVCKKNDEDVQKTLPQIKKRRAFNTVLHQVDPPEINCTEAWFETISLPGYRRGVDTAIKSLAVRLQEIGICSILTPTGYRFYFCNAEPRHRLPQLAAGYAAMFYLGAITRYRPYDFDKILAKGYSWVVKELLATQPAQFLYCLASHLAGVDVVKPQAKI